MKALELFNHQFKGPFCFRISIVETAPEVTCKFFGFKAVLTAAEVKKTPIAGNGRIDNIEILKLDQHWGFVGVSLNYNNGRVTRRLEASAENQILCPKVKLGSAPCPLRGLAFAYRTFMA